ncbi:unnamed protein product [Oikopleura dioica]|uniref:Uncharacterized protein n=1 Tax=Oikopleura dioica TaxID=34765 RepID=E4Z133_OIKDI|nr:unnamed protein product [Oikopleura dioica]
MDSGRKRSTTVEFDPIVLAQSARAVNHGIFAKMHPELASLVVNCHAHPNGNSVEVFDNPGMADELNTSQLSLTDRIILKKIHRLAKTRFARFFYLSKNLRLIKQIAPNLTQKRLWDPLEDENEAVPCHPPLEEVMKTSEARSFSKFMQDLVPGDILVGKVKSWRRANFEMELVGLDCGRLRKVPENISILCNVPQKEEILEEGDLVRCVFERFQKDVLIATTEVEILKNLDPLMALKTKLGAIDRMRKPSGDAAENESIHDVITSSKSYLNPTGSHYILERLGVDLNDSLSFLTPIVTPKEEQMKSHLRERQSKLASKKYVTKGVECFKKGEHQEAMNNYRTALELDKENTDALVARGALYSSKKQWRAACEDLEAAYKIDPTHKNAKDYLIRVLFDWSNVISAQALSGNESSKPDLKRATTLLEQILDLEPGHEEARSKLLILRKPSVFASIQDQINDRIRAPEDDKVTKIDKEIRKLMKKKDKEKRRELKKSKKSKKDRRSISSSRSPGRGRNRSGSSNDCFVIEEKKPEKRMAPITGIYLPPKRRVPDNFKQLDALSRKTENVKGNLSDILQMLK